MQETGNLRRETYHTPAGTHMCTCRRSAEQSLKNIDHMMTSCRVGENERTHQILRARNSTRSCFLPYSFHCWSSLSVSGWRAYRLRLDEGIRASKLHLDVRYRRRDIIGRVALVGTDSLHHILQRLLEHVNSFPRNPSQGNVYHFLPELIYVHLPGPHSLHTRTLPHSPRSPN